MLDKRIYTLKPEFVNHVHERVKDGHKINRDYKGLCVEYPELLNVPLVWSKQLTRCLGTCHYIRKAHTGICIPTKIMLSYNYLLTNTYETMYNVLLHECAHALAIIHDGDRGHGWSFKKWCRKLGVAHGFNGCHAKGANKGFDSKVFKITREGRERYIDGILAGQSIKLVVKSGV